MKSHIGPCVVLLAIGCKTAPAEKSAASASEERSFHFEYAASVGGIPAGSKSVRIWIPLPQSDSAQTITNLKVTSPAAHRETRDEIYGNRIAYFEAAAVDGGQVPVTISFDVHRKEVTLLENRSSDALRARLLEGDKLAPLAGEASTRAQQAAGGKGSSVEKARGIYDRVLADVVYDKTTPGWGKGDLTHVCDVGKGNCSDFHALFIAMARAQEIPSFFEIGFPLPRDKTEGAIAGYHCWAWYESKDGAWRPVDASEAGKDPSRKEYFFGTICCNRVALSRGRDLVLEPRQDGPPLNFFIYPYVEVDGKPLETGIEKRFSFKDSPPAS